MAAPIQKIARMAFQCFSRKQHDSVFHEQLKTLRSHVNTIRAVDLGFDPLTVRERKSARDPPVTYVKIWEDDVFTIGIFVLKAGSRLPMHDHPEMFGYCKVIHGTLHVKSFTEVRDQQVPTEVEEGLTRWQKPLIKTTTLLHNRSFGVNDECCFLTPSEGNIHELQPDDGMTAFLDILSPPYNHTDRDCHYFKELTTDQENNTVTSATDSSLSQIRYLIQIPQPQEYWCDSLDYKGPSIEV